MPAQEGIRLHDEQRRLPERCGSSEHEKFDAVKVVELRTFGVAVEDNELLPQEGVFGDQVRLAGTKSAVAPFSGGKVLGFSRRLI